MDKLYDLNDDQLDITNLLLDIFNYLVNLENENTQCDESIQVVKEKLIVDNYDNKKQNSSITTIDDENKTKYNKYYFNGECDSNQTRYEMLSNHLRVATVAQCDTVGLCLHTFLRQVIDDHNLNWFTYMFDMCHEKYTKTINGEKNHGQYTVKEIVNTLVEYNNQFGQTFDPRENGLYVTTTLRCYDGTEIIKRYIGDVDVWNIYRIFHVLGVIDSNKQHEHIDI